MELNKIGRGFLFIKFVLYNVSLYNSVYQHCSIQCSYGNILALKPCYKPGEGRITACVQDKEKHLPYSRVFHKIYTADFPPTSCCRHKWEGQSKAWDCFTVEMLVEDLCFCPLNGPEYSQRCGNYSAFCDASFFCATTGPKPASSAKSHRTKDLAAPPFQHLSS